MLNRTVFSLVLLLASSAFAQTAEFERVLLPISSPEVGGAFGSRWVTEHFGRNDGDTSVEIERDDCAGLACLKSYPPHTTFHPEPSTLKDHVWLSVEKSKANQMFFSTIVRDIGKDIEPWGTEIPSVREGQFRQDKLQLLNVPGSTKLRKNLRIYIIPDLTQGNEATLVVRIFDMDAEMTSTARQLGEKTYTLRNTQFANNLEYLPVFYLDNEFPQMQTAERVRIEVQKTSGIPLKLWALVTATNNVTQHVTIFTP
ncbi:MAG: hypothetical protein ACXWH1_14560 [Thermoanaerobaculia bacterium]